MLSLLNREGHCETMSETQVLNAWESLELVFEFCLENNLLPQANRAVCVASSFGGPSNRYPVHMILRQVVAKFGWSMTSDAMRTYLCPGDLSNIHEIEERIRTINILAGTIPREVEIEAFGVVLKFLRLKGSVIRWRSITESLHLHRVELWKSIIEIFDRICWGFRGKAIDSHQSVLSDQLVSLCETLDEKEIAAIVSAMKARNTSPAGLGPVLEKLRSTACRRIITLRTTRFLEEVQYVIRMKALPSGYIPRRIGYWGRLVSSEENWSSFISFTAGVISAEDVKPECVQRFQDLLAVIPSLSKERLNWMSSALVDRDANSKTEAIRSQIRNAVDHADDVLAEKVLVENVKFLEQKTSSVPANVPVKYDAETFAGMPKVQSFLMGAKMETRLTGYTSVVTARKFLKSFQGRLPQGIEGIAGGIGRRSYIHLKKPFMREREIWLQYRSDRTALRKAETELKTVQSRLRAPRVDGDQPETKKHKGNEGLISHYQ